MRSASRGRTSTKRPSGTSSCKSARECRYSGTGRGCGRAGRARASRVSDSLGSVESVVEPANSALSDACDMAAQYLHENKVLHRDLKPKNIFVGADDRMRVGDLGCSKSVSFSCPFLRSSASHRRTKGEGERWRVLSTPHGRVYFYSPLISSTILLAIRRRTRVACCGRHTKVHEKAADGADSGLLANPDVSVRVVAVIAHLPGGPA